MVEPLISDSPHSSAVTLTLVASNGMFPLSQIGPDRVTLRSPARIAAGDASIVMVVDGREHRWTVNLDDDVAPRENITELRVRLCRDNLTTQRPLAGNADGEHDATSGGHSKSAAI